MSWDYRSVLLYASIKKLTMPKKPLQDIVPKPSVPRRVIREEQTEVETLPPVRSRPLPPPPPQPPRPATRREVPDEPTSRYIGKRKRFPLLWGTVGIVVLLAIAGLLLSIVFSGASITVHPKYQEAFLNGEFIATQDNIPGQLQFKTTAIEKVAVREVPATKSEVVSQRATGKIMIYNNFDDKPQRLITNTRFETKDGKVFRVLEPVTVPGKKTGADGAAVPGSIEATVTADEPGESYNIPPSEFKIPGFEGTPRYDGFYATSKNPMSGGFEGKRNTVEDEALAQIQTELETSLKTELAEQSKKPDQMPEGYYAFEGAFFYQFEKMPIENSGDNVKIQVKGTLHNVLFDQAQFAKHLATAAIAGYDDATIVLENPDEIKVTVATLEEDMQAEMPWQNTSIRVRVEGTGKFIWQFDETQLKADLAGKEKAALQTILSSYPSIEKAEVTVRPFWNSSFPDDQEKIVVTKSLD